MERSVRQPSCSSRFESANKLTGTLVYELYELTDAERAVVEGAG